MSSSPLILNPTEKMIMLVFGRLLNATGVSLDIENNITIKELKERMVIKFNVALEGLAKITFADIHLAVRFSDRLLQDDDQLIITKIPEETEPAFYFHWSADDKTERLLDGASFNITLDSRIDLPMLSDALYAAEGDQLYVTFHERRKTKEARRSLAEQAGCSAVVLTDVALAEATRTEERGSAGEAEKEAAITGPK